MATEKRVLDTYTFWASHIIFDIEGTTTSISFVKDTLFPYIREHLNQYLNDNWKDEGFQNVIAALREQAKIDENDGLEGFVAIPDGDGDEVKNAVIKNVLWQMDNDRKIKSLKDLQSLVMTDGYGIGKITGHIYDDVETNLKMWKDQGKHLYIYSSGSVSAQKLLFGNTNKGNLLNLFSGHFDTVVGPKGESSSYKKIVEEIKCEPGDILFFTDVPAEAKAAVGAGLQAVLVSRDGNAPLSDQDKADFTIIHSFSDIEFEQSTKKRKMLDNTSCDSVIDNKEIDHSSTYISEVVNGKGDDQIKPNISVDTDVEMAEVEEKPTCTGASKEKTKTTEEMDSNRECDVDMKVQQNSELTNDNVRNSESIDENNTSVPSKNEIVKTEIYFTEKKKDDIEEKKEDVDVGLDSQKKNECSTDSVVDKENSTTDSSENGEKSVKELSDNQSANLTENENGEVERTGFESQNSLDNNGKNEIELSVKSETQEQCAVTTKEEMTNASIDKDNVETTQTDKTDKRTIEMVSLTGSDNSDINDVKNEVENLDRKEVVVHESETNSKTAVQETSVSSEMEIVNGDLANDTGEATRKNDAGCEKVTHETSIKEDEKTKEGDVKENYETDEKSEAVSCTAASTTGTENTVKPVSGSTVAEMSENTESKATIVDVSESSTTKSITDEIVVNTVQNSSAVEMVENAVSDSTAGEIAETPVSNSTVSEITDNEVSITKTIEIAENGVSDASTTVDIAKNAVSNTTAIETVETTDVVMDVSETDHDTTECKSDALKSEEIKSLSDGNLTTQNEKEMIAKEITTEANGTSVCGTENSAEKKESGINKDQEKIIVENSVCSKMETETCDVSDTCEKDNTLCEKSDAKKTVSDSAVELRKEESKPLNVDEPRSGASNIIEKENNEESMKTENSEVTVCVNSVNETKVECSDVKMDKVSNSNHAVENTSDVKEKMYNTSVPVNGNHGENDSCDGQTNGISGDVCKAQMEITPNGDVQESHESNKTDDKKTDTLNEKIENNSVTNGGTENVADAVPEVKKVTSDATNNSALEPISEPI